MNLEHIDKQVLWHPFTQQEEWERDPQIVIERAEGFELIDTEGRRYLDGVSSLWVNVHGHQRPEIDRAITDQLGRVAHSTFLGLSHPPGIRLAQRLIQIVPGDLARVFYSDTGAAAVEIALKMAFQFWQQCDRPRPERMTFLSLGNAYHGDTVGAMSVGGMDIYRQTYRPLLFETVTPGPGGFAPVRAVEAAIADHADRLAAVIMEPVVQGAAGILPYPSGYTRRVWEAARRHDVLFIVDEVATGFGRTGTMFACEHEGIEPDLMALGKGITGGYLPLAATLATERIYRAFLGPVQEGKTFYHGHTYTGNPLACAAALASLDLFERDRVIEHLQPKIARLERGLERFMALPMVGDIRQAGFMAGIDLVQDRVTGRPFPPEERVAVQVVREARARGAIIRPLGDTLVLMPPLAIPESDLDRLLEIVGGAVSAVMERVL